FITPPVPHRALHSFPTRRSSDLGKKRVLKGFFYTLFICLVVLLSLSLGAAGVAAGYVAALVKDEPVRDKNYFDQKLSGWHQTSYAYFRDKSLIGSVRTLIGDRKLVENDEVSQYLIDALISTEDREFYNHSGIVPRSLLRAVYEDLTNQKVVTGGSTITQQLVKRAILENYSKTYDRKAKEILLALRLERMYSKEEILNAYLNSLYFRSEEHTSELQSRENLVCRLLLGKKNIEKVN